jgi:hypothetical protein|tara:strand:- start:1228 stop:1479 length:252 start_codon:yes stop_codon:yes gene_type:complete
MSIEMNKDELQAVAECIQTAWQNGVVKSPVFAHHLISASQKLGQEFERVAGVEETSAKFTPPEEIQPVQDKMDRKNVPVDISG